MAEALPLPTHCTRSDQQRCPPEPRSPRPAGGQPESSDRQQTYTLDSRTFCIQVPPHDAQLCPLALALNVLSLRLNREGHRPASRS